MLKFQTELVKNSPVPTWNAECELQSFGPGDVLDFSIDGIDRDGWPKKVNVLGRAALPYDKIHDDGFDGELDVTCTKGGAAVKLKVQVAVLCLWDSDADVKVPHENTKQVLQDRSRNAKRAVQEAWELDKSLEEARNRPFKELDMPPCNVFDLLIADSQRRKKDVHLNREVGIQQSSAMRKQPWVWKEVESVLNRVVYDPPPRVVVADSQEEESKTGAPKREPRTHLNALIHPEDGNSARHEHDSAELAMSWPKDRIKMRDCDAESSEAWSGSESTDDSQQRARSPNKLLPVGEEEATACRQLVKSAPELLTWKGQGGETAKVNSKRVSSYQAPTQEFSLSKVEISRMENLRRASSAGPDAGRYRDMRPLLQAAGIKPSELIAMSSDESEEDRAMTCTEMQSSKQEASRRQRFSIAEASPTAAASLKMGLLASKSRQTIGAISVKKTALDMEAKSNRTSRRTQAVKSSSQQKIAGDDTWVSELAKSTQNGEGEVTDRRGRRGKSIFEGSRESRLKGMQEFQPKRNAADTDKKQNKDKKEKKSSKNVGGEAEGDGGGDATPKKERKKKENVEEKREKKSKKEKNKSEAPTPGRQISPPTSGRQTVRISPPTSGRQTVRSPGRETSPRNDTIEEEAEKSPLARKSTQASVRASGAGTQSPGSTSRQSQSPGSSPNPNTLRKSTAPGNIRQSQAPAAGIRKSQAPGTTSNASRASRAPGTARQSQAPGARTTRKSQAPSEGNVRQSQAPGTSNIRQSARQPSAPSVA